MFTRFEEYAASQMLGHADSPPRSQGKLFFAEAWQRQLFGLTLAVAKQGHFDWEDFRQHLIESIGDWVLDAVCAQQARWLQRSVDIVPVAVSYTHLTLPTKA